MVQGTSMTISNNLGGTVNRVGTTDDGRGIYQMTEVTGEPLGRFSVAQKDCDTFERSFRQIIENAPKVKNYLENTTPEELEKKQKKAKWIVGLSSFAGGIIPALTLRGNGVLKTLLQIGTTALGCLAGFVAGSFVANKVTIPPGMAELNEAHQNLRKLDVQPME